VTLFISHNKPTGCGAPEAYAPGSDDEEDAVIIEWHFNPLNPELNPICYLLALLGAHHFLHVSRIRVKLLTLR